MLDDLPVLEPEPGLDVVDHLAPRGGRCRWRSSGPSPCHPWPSGRPARPPGPRRATGQHPPHVPRLGPAEIAEDGIVEAPIRRVQPGHGVAVVAVERLVELANQLARCRPRADTILDRLGAWRSLVARTVRVGEVPGSNPGAPINSPHDRLATRAGAGGPCLRLARSQAAGDEAVRIRCGWSPTWIRATSLRLL